MKKQGYSWKNIIGAAAVMSALVACGSTGGETPGNGTPPPVESSFTLEHTFAESEVGYETWFQAWSIGSIEDGRGFASFYSQTELDTARQLNFVFDADEFVGFDATTFTEWYFPWVDGEAAEVTISNPAAQLKVTSNMRLGQFDSNRQGYINSTHGIQFQHEYLRADDSTVRSFARAVHSDRAVDFTGDFDMNGYKMRVDMRLQPGWNLVASEFHPDGEDSIQTWQRQPVDTAILNTYPTNSYLSDAPVLNNPYYLVAVYPLHQVNADPPTATPITTYFRYSQDPAYGELMVPAWLHPSNVPSGVLVPLAEAAGNHPDTEIIAPPELNTLIARALTFDEADPDFTDSSNATGELFATTVEGNSILFLYADHDATVEINRWVSPFTGEIAAADDSLDLEFGWNQLVTVPDPDSATRDFRIIQRPLNTETELTHQLN